MQETLRGFSAAARHDIKKCRWDGKTQRVIKKRIEVDIEFDLKKTGCDVDKIKNKGNSEVVRSFEETAAR